MTYDDWKLETPEDEYERKNRSRDFIWRCRDCGTTHQLPEANCRNCNSEDLEEEPLEPDPDDARDEAWERRMLDSRWDCD
jgi:uncharacterized OB-fold protein